MSDSEFEDENDDKSLLLTDKIDVNDYECYFRKDFNERQLSLFLKWYTVDQDEKTKYRLNETNLFNSSAADLNELDELYHAVRTKYPLNATTTAAANSNTDGDSKSCETNLSLKYLKSIQQEEIELVVKHIDPSSIVWLNLNDSKKTNQLSPFNQTRFQAILKLLQSHVLAHNYKECLLSDAANENVFSKFLFNSINTLIESYIENINKRLNCSNALSKLFYLGIFFLFFSI